MDDESNSCSSEYDEPLINNAPPNGSLSFSELRTHIPRFMHIQPSAVDANDHQSYDDPSSAIPLRASCSTRSFSSTASNRSSASGRSRSLSPEVLNAAGNKRGLKGRRGPGQVARRLSLSGHDNWNMEEDNNGGLIITDMEHQAVHRVPRNRAARFIRSCNAQSISKCLQPSSCDCPLKCYESTTYETIRKLRIRYCICENESACTALLVRKLEAANANIRMGERVQHVLNGKNVCGQFFRNCFAISKDKMKNVRMCLYEGSETVVHGNANAVRNSKQYKICYAFWDDLFKKLSERPNQWCRLFPCAMTMQTIFEKYFTKFCTQVLQPPMQPDDMPSVETLRRARYDEAYSDVEKRRNHRHARCPECSKLHAETLEHDRVGFNNPREQAEFEQKKKLHEEQKFSWRKEEATLMSRGQARPSEYDVYQYDDTDCQATGFPHFSNRDPKNITKSRVNFTPFNIKNWSSGKEFYIYMLKDKWAKGANRTITLLYEIMMATKHSQHEAAHARHLVLMCDNASDQKNNDVLCFLAELIYAGWYDTARILYGPVGHTHTGRDSRHHILNDLIGSQYAMTLGEHAQKYSQYFDKAQIPEPVFMDHVYDWKARYQKLENMNQRTVLEGFRKARKNDRPCVHGWMARRHETSRAVEIVWRVNGYDHGWRGRDAGIYTY